MLNKTVEIVLENWEVAYFYHKNEATIPGKSLFSSKHASWALPCEMKSVVIIIILITEALDKQLRIKISDKNCEWRFDESFIIFKIIKTKSQILVSSLYAKMSVC